jgi:hypothetical protein
MKKYFLLAVILFVAAISHAFQADFNYDGIVNFTDFAVLADEWVRSADGVIDSYTTGGQDTSGVIYQNVWRGQRFIASSNYTVTGISLLLCKAGNPGTVIVSIRNCNGGPVLPDLCSATINGNILTTATSGAYYTVTLDTPILLISGGTYSIVVEAPNATAAKYVIWLRDAYVSTYTCEKSILSGTDGSWTETERAEHLFKVLGE